MLANPIIRREVMGLFRRPQAIVALLAVGAALSGVVVVMWPDDATVTVAAVGGDKAREVFRATTYGLLVALLLAVPAFPATAIARERDRGTLGLVLTSPLRPVDIVTGKLSAAMAFVAMLIAVSLPATMACFVMGGIDAGQVARTFGVLALAACEFSMVALLVSSFARSTDGALRITYALTLGGTLLVLLPQLLLQGMGLEGVMAAAGWVYCISPIPAINELTGQAGVGSMGYLLGFDPVARYVMVSAGVVVVVGAWLLRRLTPRLLDRPRATGFVTDEGSAGQRAMRRVLYLWFFDPHRRAGPIGNLANPVLVKEFRSRTLGRAHWMMRLVGACLIVSLALTLAAANWAAASPEKVGYLGGTLVVFQMALIIFVTPSLSAALVSAERESGAWQLLQTTPLKPRQIMFGKLLSVVGTVVLLLLATLPGYVVLVIVDEAYLPRVKAVLVTLALTALFALMAGATCSAIWRKTAATTAAAYLVLVGVCVGTLAAWLVEGVVMSADLVHAILRFNPLAAGLSIMRVPGFAGYDLATFTWKFLGVSSAALAVVLWARTWWLTRPE